MALKESFIPNIRKNDSDIEQYSIFDLREHLDPNSILTVRANIYKEEPYYSHHSFEKVKTKILDESNRIVFIIGNPLAGKTRSVYDAIKKINLGHLVIPKNENVERQYNVKLFSKLDKSNTYVLFDDLEDYLLLNPSPTKQFLKYLITNGFKTIITCKSGPELKVIRELLGISIFSMLKLNSIEIPRLNKNEESLAHFVSLIDDEEILSRFDGNIGSLILDLEAMRTRYKNLLRENKILPVAILKALKLHCLLLNYEGRRYCYSIKKIKLFCERYLKKRIQYEEWNDALMVLMETDEDLNFLRFDSEKIWIEEAYLNSNSEMNNDVIYNFSYVHALDSLKLCYNKFEIKGKGFVSLSDLENLYTKLKWMDYFECKRVIKLLKNLAIKPNTQIFNLLIKKSNTFERAKSHFQEISNSRQVPDIVSIIYLLEKCNSFSFAIELYENHLRSTKRLSYNKKYSLVIESIFLRIALSDKESLKSMLSKFAGNEYYLFSNDLYNKIIQQCCLNKQNIKEFIKKHYEAIRKQKDTVLNRYGRTFSLLGEHVIGIKLIEECKDKGYYYYLAKANCYEYVSNIKAEEYYFEALNSETYSDGNKIAVAKKAIGEFILKTRQRTKYRFAIEYVEDSYNYFEIKNDRRIGDTYKLAILLYIEITEMEKLREVLLEKLGIGKRKKELLKDIHANIVSEDKKNMFKSIFKL